MINNNIDEASPVTSKVQHAWYAVVNGYPEKDINTGPIEISVSYINNLHLDITVVERNGFRHIVPTTTNPQRRDFYIRTNYSIKNAAYEQCKKFFAGYRGSGNDDIKLMKELFDQKLSGIQQGSNRYQMNFEIDHIFTLEDFNNHNGSLLDTNKDIVLSTLSLDKAPAHYAAIGSVSENVFINSFGKDQIGFTFGLTIEMVNRTIGATPMFIYAMNEVYTIPISGDIRRAEGFYINKVKKDIRKENIQDLITEYYPLSEANKLFIFKSVEEAKTAGNVKLLREEELSNARHQLELMKNEATANKLIHEKETLILNNNFTEKTRLHEGRLQESKEEQEKLRRINETREQANKMLIDQLKRDHETHSLNQKMELENNQRRDRLREFEQNEKIRVLEMERSELAFRLEQQREALKDKTANAENKRKLVPDVFKIFLTVFAAIGAIFKLFKSKG